MASSEWIWTKKGILLITIKGGAGWFKRLPTAELGFCMGSLPPPGSGDKVYNGYSRYLMVAMALLKNGNNNSGLDQGRSRILKKKSEVMTQHHHPLDLGLFDL